MCRPRPLLPCLSVPGLTLAVCLFGGTGILGAAEPSLKDKPGVEKNSKDKLSSDKKATEKATTGKSPTEKAPVDKAADRDLVILDNQQTIAGRLEEDPTSQQHVLIRTATGTLRLRKERVKSTLMGLTGRIAAVKDTDFQGLVNLARWCLGEKHPAEALAALDKAMRLVRADPRLLKDLTIAVMYLRLVAEERGSEAALPLYRWYRQIGGTDPDTLRQLGVWEAIAGTAPNSGAPAVPLPPSTVSPSKAPTDVASPPRERLTEGLETKGWQAENEQWSNPISSKLVPLSAKDTGKDSGDAKRTLEITCGAGGKDKATLRKPVTLSAVEKHILIFRLKNSAEIPIRVAVGIKTGDYTYFESEAQTVKFGEGFKEVRFNLTAKNFKSSASNWAYTGAVENLDDVKELQVLFYNRDAEITAFISGMRLIAEDDL